MTAWRALREGFDAFTQRFPLLMGSWLVIIACHQLINLIGLIIPNSWLFVEVLISVTVLAPLYAGQQLLSLKVVRREPVTFAELFAGFSQWRPIMLASFIVSLLTLLGFVALIVPGIIVALMYSFAPISFLTPDEGMRTTQASEAMSESARITKGYRMTLFGIGLLLSVPYLVLVVLLIIRVYDPIIPIWIIEVIATLSGILFLGPVYATSYMVVYDHAISNHRW